MRKVLIILLALSQIGLSPLALAEDGTDRLVRLAVRAQLDGKNDQALALYTQALSEKSLVTHRKAALFTDRGVIFARLGRTKAALDDFNNAIKLFPENPSVYNNRGSTLVAIGYDREAIKDFNRAILLAPGYAAAYLNRGSAHFALKDATSGLLDYNRAVRLEPGNAVVLNARGVVHLKAGRLNTALRDFTHAIASNARFDAAYGQRAETRMQLADYTGAIEDLSRAIAYSPQNPQLYLQRGLAYLQADDTEAAVRDFSKTMEMKEASPRAYRARGLAHAFMDDNEAALADLTRALELDQRSAENYAFRAFVYRQTEQLPLADRDIVTAKRLNSTLSSVRWVEGEIAEARGNTEKAVKLHRSVLADDPSFRFSKTALERLQAETPYVRTQRLDTPALGDWTVIQKGGRYYATNDKIGGVEVPLEPIGGAPPRLIDWRLRPRPHHRYGILRFSAGPAQLGKAKTVLENAAIVDVRARKMLAVVPHRDGSRKAEWTWSAGRLQIQSADGVRDAIKLDAVRTAPAVAGASSGRRRRSYDSTPSWSPWASQDRRARRRITRRRRRKPKTIFDVIFGN